MEGLTRSFEQAVARAAALSPPEQDALAALILSEIQDGQRWETLFQDRRSSLLLKRLAAEALAEDEAGLTEPLDALLTENAGQEDPCFRRVDPAEPIYSVRIGRA